MEVASAIIGVVVGVFLTAGWELWKESRTDKKSRSSIRALVVQEVQHNIRCLTAISEAVGSATLLINNIEQSQGHELSQDTWISQMGNVHTAFSKDEVVSLYDYYGRIRNATVSLDRVHNYSLEGSKSRPRYRDISKIEGVSSSYYSTHCSPHHNSMISER